MKLKKELTKFGWKQFIKVAVTLSVGVGLKWSCDKIEHQYYPVETVGEIIVLTDTLLVPLEFVDTVFVTGAPDTMVRVVMLEPGPFIDTVTYAVPFVDTVTVYDHVTVLDTVPWFEPEPVNPNGWKINPRRP